MRGGAAELNLVLDDQPVGGRVVEAELIGLGLLDAAVVQAQPKDNPLYKKYFPHGLSHHLGLDVHDYGDRFRPFEAGMVLVFFFDDHFDKDLVSICPRQWKGVVDRELRQ